MHRIIDTAFSIVQECVDCGFLETCQWFQQAKQVTFDDVTPEQYAEMTPEDIANKVHRNNVPPDYCDQYAFRGIMQKVESFIETATIPEDAGKVVDLVTKLRKPLAELYNEEGGIIDAFDPIVRSIVCRTLAAIDFHFLRKKVDMSALINAVHNNSPRERLMSDYYSTSIYESLLKNARKLSLDDILTCEGKLANAIPAPKPAETTQNQAQITKPAVQSRVEDFIKHVKDSGMEDCGVANLLLLGYTPLVLQGGITDKLRKKYLAEDLTPKSTFKYDHFRELTDELTTEIHKRKYSQHELTVYLSKILTELEGISCSLYPWGKDNQSREISTVVAASGFLDTLSVADANALIAKCKRQLDSDGKQRELDDYYSDLYTMLAEQGKETRSDGETGPFGPIHDITMTMTLFESSLEAALLANGLPVDYHYFEAYANVHFGQEICDIMICSVSGMNPSTVVNTANLLGHSIYTVSLPGESSAEFSYRLFKAGLGEAKMIIPDQNREIPKWAEDEDEPEEQIQKPKAEPQEKKAQPKDNIPTLPPSLKTEKAMAIWKKAQDVGIVDENYEFLGSVSEMAFFAGLFSNHLFGKSNWKIFRKWHEYENYSKTYHEYSGKPTDKLSEEMQLIFSLFQ